MTQAFGELELEVESCSDIFSALERVTGQSFDIILADLDQGPEAGFLLKTFFFVYIGLSINLYDDWLLFVSLVLVGLLLLIRPVVARVSISRTTSKRDASIIAVMVPRGLAAAALASLPLSYGLPDGQWMQSVSYGVILFSIVLSSLFAFMVDKTPVGGMYRLMFKGFGSESPEWSDETEELQEVALEAASEAAPETWS